MKKDSFKQSKNYSKLVLHIPHSSMRIPEKYRDIFVSEQVLKRELNCMTDLYTDELFSGGNTQIILPISRLLCDVERFRNPHDELMTANGMWICYTHASDKERLANFNEMHVQDILKHYYDVHHEIFTRTVEEKLVEHGKALVIDCHSFPSVPLPYEYNQIVPRPEICLGADDFHTSPSLVEALKKYFLSCGLNVAVNNPFSGSIVPLKYYSRDKRVESVMIEINRALYMDENSQKKKKQFTEIKSIIDGALKICRLGL